MATENAYENIMTETDRELLKSYGQKYNEAKAAGDTAAMQKAHKDAEALRNAYGFTGNADGAGYRSTLTGSGNPYIDAITEAQRQADIASYANAYHTDLLDLKARQAKLDDAYRSAQNSAYTQNALNQLEWNEYAAGAGLGSGTGGQALLARQNALQQDLSAVSRDRADTLSDLELQRSQLETEYKNSIRSAILRGEMDRADKLYKLMTDRAKTLSGAGYFDELKKLGYTNQMIQALKSDWQRRNRL